MVAIALAIPLAAALCYFTQLAQQECALLYWRSTLIARFVLIVMLNSSANNKKACDFLAPSELFFLAERALTSDLGASCYATGVS